MKREKDGDRGSFFTNRPSCLLCLQWPQGSSYVNVRSSVKQSWWMKQRDALPCRPYCPLPTLIRPPWLKSNALGRIYLLSSSQRQHWTASLHLTASLIKPFKNSKKKKQKHIRQNALVKKKRRKSSMVCISFNWVFGTETERVVTDVTNILIIDFSPGSRKVTAIYKNTFTTCQLI